MEEDKNPLFFKKDSTSSIDEGWFCSYCNKNNYYNDIKCISCGKDRNYLKKNNYPVSEKINVDFLNDIPTVKSIQVNKMEELGKSNMKNSLEMSGINNENNDNKKIWICPKCTNRKNNSNFCPECGTKRPE